MTLHALQPRRSEFSLPDLSPDDLPFIGSTTVCSYRFTSPFGPGNSVNGAGAAPHAAAALTGGHPPF